MSVEAAQALWQLSEEFESEGSFLQAVKCLEAICQSVVRFPPWIEVKTRKKLAILLLKSSENVKMAQTHLERALVVLKQIPGQFPLKCSIISILSHCYSLGRSASAQKQMIIRGINLTDENLHEETAMFWKCNFSLQLATFLFLEGELQNSLTVISQMKDLCQQKQQYGLQLLYTSSILQIQVLAMASESDISTTINDCKILQSYLQQQKMEGEFLGLFLYIQLLCATWHLNTCQHPQSLSLSSSVEKTLKDALSNPEASKKLLDNEGKIILHSSPFPVSWLPFKAVASLAEILTASSLRAKGNFKEAAEKLRSVFDVTKEEFGNLGIKEETREEECDLSVTDLLYFWGNLRALTLEHICLLSLSRSNFKDALKCVFELCRLSRNFPKFLGLRLSSLHCLRGHYLHLVGNFPEAIQAFSSSKALSQDIEWKMLCDIFSSISLLAERTTEAQSQALDLLTPVLGIQENLSNKRLKIGALLGMGLIRFSQGNVAESRIRLASGLKLSHNNFGSPHLLSQFLLPLGSLCFRANDLEQAREVLKSALTTSRIIGNLPTQVAGLQAIEEVYSLLGDSKSVGETHSYCKRKSEQLTNARNEALAMEEHQQVLAFSI